MNNGQIENDHGLQEIHSGRLEYSGLKWIEIWAKERIYELHLCLEAPGIDTDTTNLIRGQIQNARRCLEDAERAYRSGN